MVKNIEVFLKLNASFELIYSNLNLVVKTFRKFVLIYCYNHSQFCLKQTTFNMKKTKPKSTSFFMSHFFFKSLLDKIKE
jgi:hypothetical protein